MAKFRVITWRNSPAGLAAALDLIVWRAIVVHPAFHRLPTYTQLAIIAHEEGHLVLRHVRKRLWWLITGLWWHDPEGLSALLHEQEFEADAYCASRGLSRFMIDLLLKSKEQANMVRPSSLDRIIRLRGMQRGFDPIISPRR